MFRLAEKIAGIAASEKKFAVVLSAAVVTLFIVANFLSLGTGSLRLRDEFATLDRSYSFHTRGEYSVVYSQNRPSFKKPPLQYWMSAGLLNAGLPSLVAVRLPSFLFAILLLICTGWLTYVLFPQQPLAAAAAVCVMASNKRLFENAKMAMLDTGMAFFSVVAIIGCVLAIKKNPRWWYLVAVACGLGALQKAPVGFAMVAIVVLTLALVERYRMLTLPGFVFGRHFWLATLLMLGIALAWPLMQWHFFGFEALREAYYVQMIERFTPMGESDESKKVWYEYILDRDSVFRIPAIIAMCGLPFVLKQRELLIFPLLLGLYAIAVFFTKGHVAPRYAIVFLPFMAAALAICLFYLARASWLAMALVLLFCAQNIFVPSAGRRSAPDKTTVAALEKFRSSIMEPDSIILCDWKADRATIPPGLFSFHASRGRPFFAVASPQDFANFYSSGLLGPKLQGFCTQEQLKTIQQYLHNFTTIDQYGPYINWHAG